MYAGILYSYYNLLRYPLALTPTHPHNAAAIDPPKPPPCNKAATQHKATPPKATKVEGCLIVVLGEVNRCAMGENRIHSLPIMLNSDKSLVWKFVSRVTTKTL